jgi:hypothetical protein
MGESYPIFAAPGTRRGYPGFFFTPAAPPGEGSLEKPGYTAVSGPKKDDQSVWRGTAMKDGKSVGVAVDYQGNLVGQ